MVTKAKTIVPLRLRRLVPFVSLKGNILDLLNRDILFKLSNKALTIFTYFISANTTIVIVENNIDNPVILLEYTHLSSI